MLEGIKNLLPHRHPGDQPLAKDKVIMEAVKAAVSPSDLRGPAGTSSHPIQGITLKLEMIAGTIVPRVYDACDNRLIGHFAPDGRIVYDCSVSQS